MRDVLPLTAQTIAARLERLPNSPWHVTITVILGVAATFMIETRRRVLEEVSP